MKSEEPKIIGSPFSDSQIEIKIRHPLKQGTGCSKIPTYFLLLCMWQIISRALTLILTIILAFFRSVGRKFPWNFVLLGAFTLSYSLLIAFASVKFAADWIIFAAVSTFVLSGMLILFASQTKYDFTGWGPYLLVAVIGLLIFGILNLIIRSDFLRLLYSFLGAMLMSFYLIYDTQLIVGGKKHELDQSEYVYGAWLLYVDIVNLFLYLLDFMGR